MEKLSPNVTSAAFADKPAKDLYFCSGSSVERLPIEITPSSKCFGLFIAMDARTVDNECIERVATRLIAKGLVYLCAWGPDCERVHDAFDRAAVVANPEPTDDDVIMTTWHSNETLEEALWYFVNCALATKAYERTCRDWVVATVGNQESREAICEALGK